MAEDYAIRARAALALLDLPKIEKATPMPPLWPKQQQAADSDADIVFYGGQNSGGKTYWLQCEAMRGHEDPLWSAMVMRRTLSNAREAGSLWETAVRMYGEYGAKDREAPTMRCLFPSGARVSVAHCEHGKDVVKFDGAQPSYIAFDQVESFTEDMFFAVALGRARSQTGGETKVGATANPVDPDHPVGGWLSKLLMDGGWVDPGTGFALPEMSGVVKHSYRDRETDKMTFYSSAEEAKRAHQDRKGRPIKITFIEARAEDNPSVDESYIAKLDNLPRIEWERKRRGNWLISERGGGHIDRAWFRPCRVDPAEHNGEEYWRVNVRSWDCAHTQNSKKDRTAGVLLGYADSTGRIGVRGSVSEALSGRGVVELIGATSLGDGPHVHINLIQDPSAGKALVESQIRELEKFFAANSVACPPIHVTLARGKKLANGTPFANAAEPRRTNADGDVELWGNVDLIEHSRAAEYASAMHHFTGADGMADDDWDATAAGYNYLMELVGTSGPLIFVDKETAEMADDDFEDEGLWDT